MVVRNGRGGELKVLHEGLGCQERLPKGAQVNVSQSAEEFFQAIERLFGGTGVETIEILWGDFGFRKRINGRQDDLQGALVDLRASHRSNVAAALDPFVVLVFRVPLHGDDGSAAVGQFQEQVFAALAIDTNLLVCQTECLVKGLTIGEFLDGDAGHGRFRKRAIKKTERPRKGR